MKKRGYLASIEFVEPKNVLTSQYFCNWADSEKLETCDSLNISDGMLIQRIGKNVLTGEEEWFYDKESGTYYYYQFNKFNKDISGKYDKMLCTHFRWVEYTKSPKWSEFQGSNDNKIMFKYDREKTETGDVEGFKEWLKKQYNLNKPVEIYFIMQYPELSFNKDDYNPNPRFKPYHIEIGVNGEIKPKVTTQYELYFDSVNK